MSTQGSTAKYIDLSGQTYGLIVDAVATVARRRLDYWKSVWEIASQPYPSTAVESAVRETFERANKLSDLTFGELRTRGKIAAEYSEKLLSQVEKLQDAGIEALRDGLKSYVSTVDKVKDAAALPTNGATPKEKAANIVAATN